MIKNTRVNSVAGWVLMLTVMMGYADPVSLTRYALVIGSNIGSHDRMELKYAVSDARSFAGILLEMGGVSKDRCIVAANPDRKGLLEAFTRLHDIITREKSLPGRKEAVVYYSGHADTVGMILGNDRFTYKEMRGNLGALGVDVHIAVLDACASGSLTREKGGIHRQPFLYDAATSMEGHAYLTSSSSDEASQESDAIRSSFFTHYLISGMRGPADGNADGKVTLNEAYEFAYDETLQRTETTKAGPQHAAYDIRLKGSGDLVLTDLRTSNSLLRLMPYLHGRVYINDAHGSLLVEMYKNAGKKLEIGLDAGRFEVIVGDSGKVAAATVTLTEGNVVELSEADLHTVPQNRYRMRGIATELTTSDSYAHIPVNLSFLPVIRFNNRYNKTLTNLSICIIAGRTDRLYGGEVSSGVSVVSELAVGSQIAAVGCLAGELTGLQLAGAANLTGGNCRGLQCAGAVNFAGKNMQGLQIGGAANMSGGAASGIQLAGAVNHAGGEALLLQCAGGYNYVNGTIRGLQCAGGFNFVDGQVKCMQLAGAVNYIRSDAVGFFGTGAVTIIGKSMRGIQVSGGANVTGGAASGIQLAGAANHVQGDAIALQCAGAYNYVNGIARGLECAGAVNMVSSSCTGFLLAGGMNVAGSVNGCQVAGGLNLCRSMYGLQIAPFNICGTMRGLQIGVVNICDTIAGIPIGVFNYVRKLPPHFRISVDDAGFVQATMRSGAERVYSLLSVGTSTVFDKYQWTLGVGIGGRITTGKQYVALESIAYNVHENTIWDNHPLLHIQNALVYNVRLAGKYGIWAGPTFNLAIAWDKEKERISFRNIRYRTYDHHRFAAWPGFIGGIEL